MIDTRQFQALVEAGAISSLVVRGIAGGFLIVVNENQILEAQRGHPRCFKQLQTVATYLRSRGVAKFDMDLSQWQPEQSGIFE